MKGGSTIYSNFLKLDEEKRQRILNAAMKEFARKGYKNASTDNMVKEAAISKGALFHYFKNKRNLFLFLYSYSLEIIKNEILLKIDFGTTDIFDRRRQAGLQKFEVYKIHPLIFEFVAAAYMDDSNEIKNDIRSRNEKLMVYGKNKLYEGIDTSMFRENVDVARAIEIIDWTGEGVANKMISGIKNVPLDEVNYDEMLEEMDVYMNMLKKMFYKDGGVHE